MYQALFVCVYLSVCLGVWVCLYVCVCMQVFENIQERAFKHTWLRASCILL